MKNNTFRAAIIVSFTLFLSACALNYKVSTNIDKKNFKYYFSPSKVKIYQNETEFEGQYRYLGGVEGESCQKESHHQAPDKIDARSDARRHAFDLGANAIIFTGCTLIDNNAADKQCLASRVCFGKAYQVQRDRDE